jgi:hypothetical protein
MAPTRAGKHDGKGLGRLGIWKERRERKKVSPVAIDFTLSDSQQELQKNARALPRACSVRFADDPDGDLLASYAFTDVAGGANFDSPMVFPPLRRGQPGRATPAVA